MKMIKLSMVCGVASPVVHDGEDDGLDHIEPQEVTKPVAITVDQIRNFYPRREPRVGTRILFRNGSALAVTETFDAVEEMIRSAA